MLSASSHEHVQRAVTKLIIGDFGIMFEARLLRKIACRNAVSTYLRLAHAWWKAESDNACDPPFLKYHCGSAVCIEAHHQRGAAALHLKYRRYLHGRSRQGDGKKRRAFADRKAARNELAS